MSPFGLKLILICVIGSAVLFAYFYLENYRDNKIRQWYGNDPSSFKLVNKQLKYVLQWTRPDTEPFVFMGVGQQGFIDRKCEFTNCVITPNRNTLASVKDYDAILFHGPELVYVPILNKDFPKERSPEQKYVFVSRETAHYYPICSSRLDNYFNWTWTYRLDSDVSWSYLVIKDLNNTVVGPKQIMHWKKLEDMEPVSEEFKEKLKTKSKAAAWFVSNCKDRSGRLIFAKALKAELEKLNLTLDIYGKCGTLTCGLNEDCDKLIADNYYFYLAFENFFDEDYVTEKLLRALNHDAVPIVFGKANYTRFMPDGIYLNARDGVDKVVDTMKQLIDNPDQYVDYFRWKNHYSYHSREWGSENNNYCEFCAMLNNNETMRTKTLVQEFRKWWDRNQRCAMRGDEGWD